ncbi:MAG TPA: hypothetical protein PLP29_07060 [Candidatus Ozemobacteraceae bacterium]|nr:MAG: hypothetical protein BWY66_00047 [bacterium ADurb.Bin374]HOY66631.1 hypothetical protein [Candidatus Ozemobacteraceae bacterium]
MNEYKRRREAFIRKHFPFPESLELAIRKSEPERFSNTMIGTDPLEHLRHIDHPCRITRLLETHGYCRHFHWTYILNDTYYGKDWCALFWKAGSGLWVHFESRDIYDLRDPQSDDAIADEAWEFFFAKRKIILSDFCCGRFVKHFRKEEFSARLMVADPRNEPPAERGQP